MARPWRNTLETREGKHLAILGIVIVGLLAAIHYLGSRDPTTPDHIGVYSTEVDRDKAILRSLQRIERLLEMRKGDGA